MHDPLPQFSQMLFQGTLASHACLPCDLFAIVGLEFGKEPLHIRPGRTAKKTLLHGIETRLDLDKGLVHHKNSARQQAQQSNDQGLALLKDHDFFFSSFSFGPKQYPSPFILRSPPGDASTP